MLRENFVFLMVSDASIPGNVGGEMGQKFSKLKHIGFWKTVNPFYSAQNCLNT